MSSETPRTDAALEGWTDAIVSESRLMPADVFVRVRDVARTLERERGELIERIERVDHIILTLTMDHNSSPNYVKGFDLAQDYFQDTNKDSPVDIAHHLGNGDCK